LGHLETKAHTRIEAIRRLEDCVENPSQSKRLVHFWVDKCAAQTIRSGCNDVRQIHLGPITKSNLLRTCRSIHDQLFEQARHASQYLAIEVIEAHAWIKWNLRCAHCFALECHGHSEGSRLSCAGLYASVLASKVDGDSFDAPSCFMEGLIESGVLTMYILVAGMGRL
jgi:hypothetical protein